MLRFIKPAILAVAVASSTLFAAAPKAEAGWGVSFYGGGYPSYGYSYSPYYGGFGGGYGYRSYYGPSYGYYGGYAPYGGYRHHHHHHCR
jgi:hypothetical protein